MPPSDTAEAIPVEGSKLKAGGAADDAAKEAASKARMERVMHGGLPQNQIFENHVRALERALEDGDIDEAKKAFERAQQFLDDWKLDAHNKGTMQPHEFGAFEEHLDDVVKGGAKEAAKEAAQGQFGRNLEQDQIERAAKEAAEKRVAEITKGKLDARKAGALGKEAAEEAFDEVLTNAGGVKNGATGEWKGVTYPDGEPDYRNFKTPNKKGSALDEMLGGEIGGGYPLRDGMANLEKNAERFLQNGDFAAAQGEIKRAEELLQEWRKNGNLLPPEAASCNNARGTKAEAAWQVSLTRLMLKMQHVKKLLIIRKPFKMPRRQLLPMPRKGLRRLGAIRQHSNAQQMMPHGVLKERQKRP